MSILVAVLIEAIFSTAKSISLYIRLTLPQDHFKTLHITTIAQRPAKAIPPYRNPSCNACAQSVLFAST